MNPFRHYVQSGDVRRTQPDRLEALSLFEDALSRFQYFLDQPFTERSAKFVFENMYEACRELLDVYLLLNGYRSYSHQASISFALEKGLLTAREAYMLDQIRETRNNSKYQGAKIPFTHAEKKANEMASLFKPLKLALRILLDDG